MNARTIIGSATLAAILSTIVAVHGQERSTPPERQSQAQNGDTVATYTTAEDYVNFVKRSVGEWKTTILIRNEAVAEGTWSRQSTPTRGCFVSKATTKGRGGSASHVCSIEGYDPGSRSWKTTSFISDGSHMVALLRTGAENLKHLPRTVVFEAEITRTSPDGKVRVGKGTWTSTLVDRDKIELLMTSKADGDRPAEEVKIVFVRKKE